MKVEPMTDNRYEIEVYFVIRSLANSLPGYKFCIQLMEKLESFDMRLIMNLHKCAQHFTSETGSNLVNEKLMIRKVYKQCKDKFFLSSSKRLAVLTMVNEVSKRINQLQLDDIIINKV